MAQRASRASIELYTVMYFKNKILEEEARVIRIMDNGFVVLIPRFLFLSSIFVFFVFFFFLYI